MPTFAHTHTSAIPAGSSAPIDVRLLGPLSATVGGHSFVPTATKPRKVLALLLLNADRVVPVSALQRELWGSRPPRSALTTVQTYILQIRKLLAAALAETIGDGCADDAAKQVLVTTASGYLFRMGGADRDVDVYDRLVDAGAQALHAGDHADASDLLGRALRLWRGEALVDVNPGCLVEAEIVRLSASLTGTLEQRLDADLQQGYHHRVLGELAALTVENPFNENLRALYMLALHRCGRRREALCVYQDARRLLVDELGLEPGPELQGLQQAILSSDPVLAGRAQRPVLTAVGSYETWSAAS